MSIAVSAYQERVLSMPESSSVICADLPVRQESLDSAQMAQAEGELSWPIIVSAVIVAVAVYKVITSDDCETKIETDPRTGTSTISIDCS